jgi:signal transduction histidine kinase
VLERPANAIAGLIALAAFVLAVAAFLDSGLNRYLLVYPTIAVAMLLVGSWWLLRQPAGTPFHDLAIPASVATVVPLLVGGGLQAPGLLLSPQSAQWLLPSAAAATLGLALADRLPAPYRVPTSLAVAGLAVAAAGVGILMPLRVRDQHDLAGAVALLLLAATTVVPGLIAGVLRHNQAATDRGRESVVAALELGVIGVTPAVAVVTVGGSTGGWSAAIPLIAWILGVLAAQFFAVRPLARTARVATTQRDQVVAAMEAERSRIAADIHDDALQELTLLGRRLDATGDAEGAASAREVAERLRAILGDLRLPILDDLGTGPALEWLVDRVGRVAGGEVRLERADQVRPPAPVELAFFRVAQEALSNAVRHGRPPIVVRYWTTATGATLSIDDAGPGISVEQAVQPESGHFGLLNMRQRAEQIGALLDVRRWPSGGTRVTLEWRV